MSGTGQTLRRNGEKTQYISICYRFDGDAMTAIESIADRGLIGQDQAGFKIGRRCGQFICTA